MPPTQEEPEHHQQQERITLQATATAKGFEILAITSGIGNGWNWTEEALKASVHLWEGAQCFIDHKYYGHSLRDLAGQLHSVQWSEEHKGIKGQLKPIGPAAPLLIELGKECLQAEASKDNSPRPNVGFSADVVFTANLTDVKTILRVLSVDLVYNPARGGAFLRELNQIHPNLFTQELLNMPPTEEEQTTTTNNQAGKQAAPAAQQQIGRAHV